MPHKPLVTGSSPVAASYFRFFAAEEGEGRTNQYWERFGQPAVEGKKRICWVVRFYYPGLAEDSHLVVFVDKKSGEVIGGTQTR